jgi:hypothetical protein
MAWLKNAMGPVPWWSTTPKLEPEASQSMTNVLVKSSSYKTGVDVSSFFSVLNAASASGDQLKDSRLRSSMSRVAMLL